ncbi:hypothetical protein JKF63_03233 [Porcisia hertigi]|uniref:UBA domain-containing protein n=1 Tax=Porcisia hertigi TaxID=2761500 RepID=A0A836ID13_9TRYP|nr:hypothetical protein JKF63_03233 [Porcisia hertigi]
MEYQILSSKGDKVTLCIDDDMTVGDVKGIAGAMLNAPEDVAMTVSLNGKLLKDDDETWGEMCGRLFLNQPLHPMQRKLFCNVTNRPVVEPQSSEMLRMLPSKEEKKLEEERERAKIAMMDSMVDSIADNPAFLENMFAMNPAINKLKKRSPEVARMLNDPDTLRMLLKMSVDPQRRREMERNMELQLAQISALPGGADMINRYMTGYMKQELGTDPEEEEEEEDEGRSEKKLRVGTLTGEESSDVNHPDPTNKASSDPLPNPWASTPPTLSGGFSQPPGGFSFGGGGFPFANSLGYPSVAVPPFLGATPNPTSLSHGGLSPAPPAPEEGGDAAGAAIKMVMQQGGSSLSVPQTTNTEAPSLGNASVAPMTSAPSSVLTEDTMQKGLSALYEMGFEDEALCREALTASGGDVEAAVDYIAERQVN